MSSFIIKIIAMICMTLDHSNYVLGKTIVLNVIGRASFPLYCFLVVVGYSKTKSLYKYILRLFIFAMISEIPYLLWIQSIGAKAQLNVLFTFIFGLITMYLYDLKITNNNGKISVIDKNNNDIAKNIHIKYVVSFKVYGECLRVFLILFIMFFAHWATLEYEAWGILLILFIHIYYPFNNEINLLGNKIKIKKELNYFAFCVGFAILAVVHYKNLWGFIPFGHTLALSTCTFIPAIIMLLNNGKKGINLKFLFYIYYPLQFIVLYLINCYIS